MATRRLRTCGLTLSLLAAPAALGALPPAAVRAQESGADTARARTRFAEGVRHFEAGEYGPALDAFRAAYAARPHPSVLVNIANCYMQLGRPSQAVTSFSRYLEEAGPTLEAARRTEVEQALAEARAAVGHLEITATPAGASIFVDGDQVGRAPLEHAVDLDPGPHVVELRTTAGAISAARVTVGRGESVRVSIGGAEPSARPTTIVPTPAGPQAVDAERPSSAGQRAPWRPPGSEPAPAPVAATPAPAPEPAAPEPAPPAAAPVPAPVGPEDTEPAQTDERTFLERVPTGAWIAGGAGVVLLGVSIGFGVAALGEQSDFDAIATRIESGDLGDSTLEELQARGRDASDAQSRDAVIADVTLALGLVAAGTAVTLVVMEEGRSHGTERSRHARSAPARAQLLGAPLRGGGLVGVAGTF